MRFRLLHFIIALALCSSAWAQDPVLDQLIDPVSLDSDGTTLSIVFDDLRADTSNTNYEAQQSDDITRWLGIPNQNPAVDQGNDRFVITAPDPGTERKFYRILVYSTTSEDRDGDGLSDNLEAAESTEPDKADTDGDGFTDGIEFASGTDPLNPFSKPNNGLPPIVQFDESNVEATEGSPTEITFSFDRPYSGSVTYNVIDRSSAKAPIDYTALSGSVSVNGTTGSIPVTWVDDLDVQQTRLLFIQLIEPAGSAYIPGGRDFVSVRLMDNDAWWSGSLGAAPETAETGSSFIARDFRIKLARDASGPLATFGRVLPPLE